MNDTILREEPIHWVQSPPQPAEASSVGTLSVEARQQAWPVAEVQALPVSYTHLTLPTIYSV